MRRERPSYLEGKTRKLEFNKKEEIYITINSEDGRAFEVFITTNGALKDFCEILGIGISEMLRDTKEDV